MSTFGWIQFGPIYIVSLYYMIKYLHIDADFESGLNLLDLTYEQVIRARENGQHDLCDDLWRTLDELRGYPVTAEQALEALDNMDDYARMEIGVDAIGPRETLEKFIKQNDK